MVEPDISVVVPTRNRAGIVERLLQQLAALDDGLVYEVIVIDEGSTDGTPEVLARYGADHGFRIVRHDEPRFLPGARNVGTELATAPWVAWIDDDDLTSPDRLRRQHEALSAGIARWSCAGRVDVDDALEVIGHRRCPDLEGLKAELLRWNVLPSAAQGLLVERDLAIQVGGYDENLNSAEDWDFCIRLALVAPPHLLDEPLVGYRSGVESMSTDTARMEAAIRKVISKYGRHYDAEGVEPDWYAIHQSLLAADLLLGRRASLRRGLQMLRVRPEVKGFVRLAWLLAFPGHFERRSAQKRAAQVPPDWKAAARRWLVDVAPITT